MRISVFTWGSYGDVRPYLALVRGLRARGHDAFLAGPDEYAAHAAAASVPHRGIGSFGDDEIRGILAAMAAEPDELQHPRIIVERSRHAVARMAEAAEAAAASSDLVVTHNLSYPGYAAAHASGRPFVTCHLFPSLIPSSATTVSGRSFGRLGNRLFWLVARRIVRNCDDALNATLGPLGVPARRDWMLEGLHSPILNLVAVSPSVLAPDPAWPAHYRATGYLHLDETYAPSDELRRFVEAGEPPVVVTFGSMYGVDARGLTELLVEAARRAGCRVVLQAGWAGLGDAALPDSVFRAEFVPHEWLFARAAAVVHHGGAGTTAAVLRAGVPGIVSYHLGDQQFWGRHTARLGVSLATIAQKKLSARWLALQLRRTLDDGRLRTRARELSARIRAEDGVAAAVAAIASFAPGPQASRGLRGRAMVVSSAALRDRAQFFCVVQPSWMATVPALSALTVVHVAGQSRICVGAAGTS